MWSLAWSGATDGHFPNPDVDQLVPFVSWIQSQTASAGPYINLLLAAAALALSPRLTGVPSGYALNHPSLRIIFSFCFFNQLSFPGPGLHESPNEPTASRLTPSVAFTGPDQSPRQRLRSKAHASDWCCSDWLCCGHSPHHKNGSGRWCRPAPSIWWWWWCYQVLCSFFSLLPLLFLLPSFLLLPIAAAANRSNSKPSTEPCAAQHASRPVHHGVFFRLFGAQDCCRQHP